ncbi:hypothetical protein [Nocardia sp. NPDC060259]|uniref:hypothetical protein n=1 Tax=Nocardia sp. NPDC060259 TaxID=3347088 RepID=UPI003646DA22
MVTARDHAASLSREVVDTPRSTRWCAGNLSDSADEVAETLGVSHGKVVDFRRHIEDGTAAGA